MNRKTSEWEELATSTMNELGRKIAEILPDLLGAVLIIIIGLFIAGVLGNLVYRLLRATGIDNLLRNTPIGQKMIATPGMRFSPSRFVGWLVRWFFILVTLITASNILGWNQINEFLNAVVLYIPNVIIAVIILVVGFVVSNLVRSLIESGLSQGPLSLGERHMLARGADIAITLFAVMAALIQLRIASDLIQTLFTGIIFALSLALGLAFGLGGREQAAKFIERQVSRSQGGGNAATNHTF